jgi:hypothetical protein
MQHIDVSDVLGIDIPDHLMDEFQYGGDGSTVARVNELKPEQTADYIIANPTSEIAQHFADERGVDITNRKDIIASCNHINDRMADRIN